MKKSAKNVIYSIRNKINGKVYIGLTTQGFMQRKREHICRFNRGERNHKLYQAFRKYGLDNFEFEQLYEVTDLNELPGIEKQMIRKYDSYNNGYNMTIGGDTVSEETKDKLSKIFTGRKITWYSKIIESRKKNLMDRTIKTHEVMNSHGMVFDVKNLKQFCRERKIDLSNLYHKSKLDRFVKGYLLLRSSTTSPLRA